MLVRVRKPIEQILLKLILKNYMKIFCVIPFHLCGINCTINAHLTGIRVCVSVCVCVYIYIYIHTHVCIYTHTHTRTHAHTHARAYSCQVGINCTIYPIQMKWNDAKIFHIILQYQEYARARVSIYVYTHTRVFLSSGH